MSKPSLRQVAKELDISPAYLSYMVNGKRPWRKDLYQRYMGVVNTFVNSDAGNVNRQVKRPQQTVALLGVDYVGAGEGIRTHTPVKVADFKSAASTFPPPRRPGTRRRSPSCTAPGTVSPYILAQALVLDGSGRVHSEGDHRAILLHSVR